MRPRTYLITSIIWLLVSGIMMTACHQDPQPATPSTVALSRSFNGALANQTLVATYPPDSLTFSATRFRNNLRIQLSPKKRHQGTDDITIRLDSTALLPGLVGDYILPPLDTTTYTQRPSSLLVFYMYTTTYNSSQQEAQTQSLYNFLPGSYLILTGYDQARQTISGRFEFRFPSWDPTTAPYLINRNWKATLRGEFTNLQIK